MTKIVCEVIKKIKEDPGFDLALLLILFQKWLDTVPASADEWPMTAQNGTQVRNSDGKPALVHQ